MTRQHHPTPDLPPGRGVLADSPSRPGGARHDAVPCAICGRPTWRTDARCERHYVDADHLILSRHHDGTFTWQCTACRDYGQGVGGLETTFAAYVRHYEEAHQ